MVVKAVVGDVRHFGLDEGVTPALYVPFQQSTTLRLTWVLHADTDPAGLTSAVRAAVTEVDPNQTVHEVMTLATLVDQSYWEWRFFGTLFWMFAGLALLLAIIGIYSVMSYTVSERTHEVGLRMALGARKSEVMALVLKQGFARVLLGLALGLPLAVLLGRVLSGALFNVAAFEAATFVGVAVLLSLVSLAAMLIPARRAANVDPLVSRGDGSRSESAGSRGHDPGDARRSVLLGVALFRHALLDVRRPCFAPRHHRDLQRHVLHGLGEDPRGRVAHGAWRALNPKS